MAAPPPGLEHPLVTALPPAMDYIDYLTLLEYQLTPQNLSTLNKLLSDDNGKLAEEIGWDLLKLVLPMQNVNPEEASRCLEIVARRGNPREVVVRVAEELEKLGDQANVNDDGDFEDDQDELPTFAGEAPRVHLGQMTLDGMPEAKRPDEPAVQDSDQATNSPQGLIKSTQLQALFNMLSILHPRIKTQFPSRFLATSLPAALGAYRQIPITTATTSAFLSMLENLAGNKRPVLPPRASTQGHAPSTSASAAPLPDPEARAEQETSGVNVPSDGEKAIIFRLLDAVLLEVLDEYSSSLASHEYPSMSLTARLREQLEPMRAVITRATETQQWKDTRELAERDALLAKFYSISKEMRMDTSHEIRKLIQEDEDETSENPYHEEEPSDYPTSPSQIPLPRAGVIYLHAYHVSHSNVDFSDTAMLLSLTGLTQLIAHSFPLSATPAIPLPALQDALLSLLYKQSLAIAAAPTTPQPSSAKFVLLHSTLTQLFTITPYPSLRDSSHYLATKLLHTYPDPSVRVRLITQALVGSTLSTNWAEIEDEEIGSQQLPEPEIVEETGLTRSTSALVPHPIPLAPPQQLAQLKAVAADWLREEVLLFQALRARAGNTNAASIGGLDPEEVLKESETSSNKGKEKEMDNPSLLDLLFPPNLPALSSTITTPSSPTESSDEDTFSDFLVSIPFHISTINLICIIVPHLPGSSPLKPRLASHLASLNTSSRFLDDVLNSASFAGASGLRGGGETKGIDESGLEESRADIAALRDACKRATRLLRAWRVGGTDAGMHGWGQNRPTLFGGPELS